MTAPFRSGHSDLLRSCSIRLSCTRQPILEDLARHCVEQSTYQFEKPHCIGTFRFFDLPRELQLQILSHTDLVTPLREVKWTPEYGFSTEIPYGGKHRPGAGNRISYAKTPCFYRSEPSGCFCPVVHSAATTREEYVCHCWEAPKQLPLVSKTFRELSQAILYAENTLSIWPRYGNRQQYEMVDGRLPAAQFLMRGGLRFLRTLNLYFPPYFPQSPETFFDRSTRAWVDWDNCIESVKDELQCEGLTLRVLFKYGSPFWSPDEMKHQFRHAILDPTSMYHDALLPLRRLSGIKHLFVQLPNLECDREFHIRNPELLAAEQVLEKQIMGEGYDSAACGKPERAQY